MLHVHVGWNIRLRVLFGLLLFVVPAIDGIVVVVGITFPLLLLPID